MKSSELREQSLVDLEAARVKFQREYFNLRMQAGMGEVPKPHDFKRLRRSIARVNTIINEKRRQA